MSLQAAWELRANGVTPRSFSVWQASMNPSLDGASGGGSSGASINPFDSVPSSITTGADAATIKAHGLIFGTEQGTLHYRAYAPTRAGSAAPGRSPTSTRGGLGGGGGGGTTGSFASDSISGTMGEAGGSSMARKSQQPLGITPTVRPPASLPRMYLPVDSGASLPGPVVGIIHDTLTASAPQDAALSAPALPPTFLVMVDDNKGDHANSSTPGAYLPYLITLQHGTFRKLALSETSNRRVTSATFSPQTGFLLAAGRSLTQVFTDAYHPALSDDGTSSNASTMVRGGSGTISISNSRKKKTRGRFGKQLQRWDFTHITLPAPGARGGQTALELTAQGRVAVVTVGNVVYAVASKPKQEHANGTDDDADRAAGGSASGRGRLSSSAECVKMLSFGQSSQVHPVILLDLPRPPVRHDADGNTKRPSSPRYASTRDEWSTIFCANGRECAVVDLRHDASAHQHRHHSYGSTHPLLEASKPRNGMVTVASPILAAALAGPYLIAVLTSDGLVSIRSPSCVAIPLRTVEVGTRPNDFFGLRSMNLGQMMSAATMKFANNNNNPVAMNKSHPVVANESQLDSLLVTMSYSCQAKSLRALPDTTQDLADRLMRHAIDAFGANGFPRGELADALQASFTATSYVGPEPTPQSRDLLRQYLQAILGLLEWESADGDDGSWPVAVSDTSPHGGRTIEASFSANRSVNASAMDQSVVPTVASVANPTSLVTGTALLCLVCTQLAPPKPALANKAAKMCSNRVGTIVLNDPVGDGSDDLPASAVQVCSQVADRLLREASQSFSLLSSNNAQLSMDLIESAVWLLRASGQHERAIQVLYERLPQSQKTARVPSSSASPPSTGNSGVTTWSPIKYASYTATHLSELWSTGKPSACSLVLKSIATHRLLQENPRLGLGVFTSLLPQTSKQWRAMLARDDPLSHPTYPAEVIKLLQKIQPTVAYDQKESDVLADDVNENGESIALPLESGRALAVTYLEAAIGISTGRADDDEEDAFNRLAPDPEMEDHIANYHDELCYLLLEGVIAERGDDNTDETDTVLGTLYRCKLRVFLRWPLTKIRSERLLSALPKSFLQEQALVLGRMGRHEDALQILYGECKSLDLALEYCDLRHERLQAKRERQRARMNARGGAWNDDPHDTRMSATLPGDEGCAYLPLVRVALQSDSDSKRGTNAAIQVLALRRGAIDRAAALRLLPKNVPVSAVARPFLIPALVDSESQVRRLTVVSSLLRSKYVALKEKLTDAQLKAQASLHVVPQLKSLNLGDPIHSTKPIKARPSSSASSTFPDVTIVKHFFPRHVVIQAIVTNNANVDGRALGNVAFVVAESSEEAIQPAIRVPIRVLPHKAGGAAWCVLSALPQRMEGTATLTCELRYTVLAIDTTTGAPLSFGLGNPGSNGRTFIEELQDLEVFSSHFA